MTQARQTDQLSQGTHVSGNVWTVAGDGEPGFYGDGGAAVQARLNEPKCVTFSNGRLYVADSENHVIRQIDLQTGVVTTIAGSPDDQPAGAAVGMLDPETSVEPDDPFADHANQVESKYTQLRDLSGTVRFVAGESRNPQRFGGDGGPATAAKLNFPTAVAVDDAGNLYIADTLNHRIRFVNRVTGIISAIAGTGHRRYAGDGGPAVAASLYEPSALVLDGRGNLYVADQGNHRVRRINLTTGVIETVAGTGESGYNGDGVVGSEASLAGPSGLACGLDGVLYIADTFNGRIRVLDLGTGMISTVVGDGGEYRYQGPADESSSSVSRPSGIAVDRRGGILVTDSDSHLIRRWDPATGLVSRVAGIGTGGYNGDGQTLLGTSLNYPFAVTVDDQNRLYIADTFNHRIRGAALPAGLGVTKGCKKGSGGC